jgi:hypothetical protein
VKEPSDLRAIAEHFHAALDGEEGGEEQVAIGEDIDIEKWRVVVFHHQRDGVQDDQEQDKVFKRR